MARVDPAADQVERQEDDLLAARDFLAQRRVVGDVEVGGVDVHETISGSTARSARSVSHDAAAQARACTATKPRQPRRYGGHQPSLPQYQAVMRGSFSGVYQRTRAAEALRHAPRAYSAT